MLALLSHLDWNPLETLEHIARSFPFTHRRDTSPFLFSTCCTEENSLQHPVLVNLWSYVV